MGMISKKGRHDFFHSCRPFLKKLGTFFLRFPVPLYPTADTAFQDIRLLCCLSKQTWKEVHQIFSPILPAMAAIGLMI